MARGDEAIPLVPLLDTNVPLRYLTGEPKDLAERATNYMATTTPVILSHVVVAEIVFVLQSFYRRPRKEIADTIRGLVAMPTVVCDSKTAVLFAMDIYEQSAVSFVDAYLVARASTRRGGRVASFDKGLDKVTNLRMEPA